MGNTLDKPVTTKQTSVGTIIPSSRSRKEKNNNVNSNNDEDETEEEEVCLGNNNDNRIEYGVSSMQGYRPTMEDTHATEAYLYAEEAIQREEGAKEGNNGSTGDATYRPIPLPGHALFAVFDGHGGTLAARYASANIVRALRRQPDFVSYARLYQSRLEKAVRVAQKKKKNGKGGRRQTNGRAEGKNKSGAFRWSNDEEEETVQTLLRSALRDAFVDLDRDLLHECHTLMENAEKCLPPHHVHTTEEGEGGGEEEDDDDGAAGAEVEAHSQQQQQQNDSNSRPKQQQHQWAQDLLQPLDAGATANVVLLTPQYIICANVGDSRSVLCTTTTTNNTTADGSSNEDCNDKKAMTKSNNPGEGKEEEGIGNRTTTKGTGGKTKKTKEKKNHPPGTSSRRKKEYDTTVVDSHATLYTGNDNDTDNNSKEIIHRAIPLSIDHKPTLPDEEARIVSAGGSVIYGRIDRDLAVSRALGDFIYKDRDSVLYAETATAVAAAAAQNAALDEEDGNKGRRGGRQKQPEVKPEAQKVTTVPEVTFHARTNGYDDDQKFIVLACDGIWDVLSNEECIDLIGDLFDEGESDLGLICEEVLDTCLAKGSLDNMTAMVVKLPSQKVGTSGGGGKGGVAKRRKAREMEEQAKLERGLVK